MIHLYKTVTALNFAALPLLCQIINGAWASITVTNILVGMLSKVVHHMLDASSTNSVNKPKKNQQCVLALCHFYDARTTLLIRLLKCTTAQEVLGFISSVLILTSQPLTPVMPPSAISGGESDHYHTPSFTSLHIGISITHRITRTTRRWGERLGESIAETE